MIEAQGWRHDEGRALCDGTRRCFAMAYWLGNQVCVLISFSTVRWYGFGGQDTAELEVGAVISLVLVSVEMAAVVSLLEWK